MHRRICDDCGQSVPRNEVRLIGLDNEGEEQYLCLDCQQTHQEADAFENENVDDLVRALDLEFDPIEAAEAAYQGSQRYEDEAVFTRRWFEELPAVRISADKALFEEEEEEQPFIY